MATKKKAKKRTMVFTDVGVHDLAVGSRVAKRLGSTHRGKSAVTGKKASNKRILEESKLAANMMVRGTRAINKQSAKKVAKKRAAKKKR